MGVVIGQLDVIAAPSREEEDQAPPMEKVRGPSPLEIERVSRLAAMRHRRREAD